MLNPETAQFVPTPLPTDQQVTNSTANPSPDSILINTSRNPGRLVNIVQQPNHDGNVWSKLVNLLSKGAREVSHNDFVHEKCHMDVGGVGRGLALVTFLGGKSWKISIVR